jgi:tetratricopeptide (TPR) repeat protein
MKNLRWFLFVLLSAIVITFRSASHTTEAAAQPNELAAALYTRTEFFGAQAIVPLPLNEARQRIAALQERHPQDANVLRTAAELDEQLGQQEKAEAQLKQYVALPQRQPESLRRLADFYARRARFAEQAATLAELLEADAPHLADNLRELLALARKHGLQQYLSADFFKQALARVKDEDAVFTVVSQYLAELQEQNRWRDIVSAVRVYRAQLPQHQHELLLVEINALVKQNQYAEAEKVYDAAFDPFWPDEHLQHFYWEFLSRHDRLRAYGRELRVAFKRDATNFNTVLRLYRYREQMDDRTAAARVFIQLEQARATRQQQWSDAELATVARLLIAQQNHAAAARYLYTLAERAGDGRLQPGHPLRAAVLYQLFRLLIDHANERTPLTQGDLRFYADVASADPHPGLLGGVLSFVLSDTNPARRLEEAEARATAHFNTTTALRLFEEYKRERPTSPHLAEMYCTLIEKVIGTNMAKEADALLAELAERYADAPQRAEVALRLADYYAAHQLKEKELDIYRTLLTHFSQRFKDDKTQSLQNVVEQRQPTLLDDDDPVPITYANVLHRYVAALTRDKRASDIAALYADALKQHPNEQWLYEEFLAWLETANLVNEQLAVYQDALQRFDTPAWTDRLARWFVRRARQQDFERLAREALTKFDETQTADYLSQHLGHAAVTNAKAFDAQLYRALYQQAHERFPHAPAFVNGLLRYHAARNEWDAWRALLIEHYWKSREWREMYLRHLASRNQLRAALDTARARLQQQPDAHIYRLFQADAAAWLSHYEEAADAYRKLAASYPQQSEFTERVVALSRSFGQRDAAALREAAQRQQTLADAHPANATYRTTAGELYAEQSDYERARQEWNQLLALGANDDATWHETATVFWDYFQYDEALRVLRAWRRMRNDETIYAYQIAAILDTQHQTAAALAEYVKALEPGTPDHWRTRQRLQALSRRKGIPAQLHAAWLQEAARSDNARRDALTLGYARLLVELDRWPDAAQLLRREMMRSTSADFLSEVQTYFRDHADAAGEWQALQRLAAHAATTTDAIAYRLQLAEHAARQKRTADAVRQLQALVKSYPTNYGVICETAEMAWRIGAHKQALSILQQARGRARGKYRYHLARRIAAKESARGAWQAAENLLVKLHQEDPRNLDVFAELARVAQRTAHAELLRERYRATIQAIKEEDSTDRYEQRSQIEEIRTQVIETFTALRDYGAAVEQHIEIINRDPDDDEKLENALRYCQRYGGADQLIAYYDRVAREAFKDYRWNLVLARLYGAKRDWPSALAQYQQAIHNQPERLELHEGLAEAAVQAREFTTAIKARERVCELTNDAPAQRIKLLEVLEKAGRTSEAAKLRAQLPQAAPRVMTTREQFAAAAQFSAGKRKEAIAQYRQAFARFAADFYQHTLSAADLQGYVETLRDEESLAQIAERLWEVRERMRVEAARGGNAKAAQARNQLNELDRNLPEVVGRVASERATGDELQALRERIATWSGATGSSEERDARHTVLLNLCWRGGLGDAAERLMIARKDAAYGLSHEGILHHDRLQQLLNFYAERGAYERALTLLVAESERDKFAGKFAYARLIAEQARLLNDRPRELEALRKHFAAPTVTANDEMVERYLTLLHTGSAAERDELAALAKQAARHHLQVVNFLIRRNEIELARAGIEAAAQNALWKQVHHAELSLAARELKPEREAHFVAALGWQTIGALLSANKQDALQGDAWLALAESYGRWLSLAEKDKLVVQQRSARFLPALLELRPRAAGEQTRLGEWLIEQGDLEAAMETLQLASAANARDAKARELLGVAYAKRGERQRALAEWQKLLEAKTIAAYESYWRVASSNGFAAEARAALQPLLRQAITREEKPNALLPLLRQINASFKSGKANEAAAYWQGLLAKDDVWLASTIIRERFVARAEQSAFYEWLIANSLRYEREDWSYIALRREHQDWSRDDMELVLDHQAREQEREEEYVRQQWQRQYLEHLIALRQHAAAAQLIATIESETLPRQPRPLWLRLAQAQLALRAGRVNEARTQLERFAGFSVSDRMTRVSAPRAERLSQALQLLNEEKQPLIADALAQAAYERQLALGQVTMAPLLELAQLAWRRNEATQARHWLALLVKLGDEATRDAALAELAALPAIKARALTVPWIEPPQPHYDVPLAEALRAAAESSAAFANYDDAIAYWQRLLAVTPHDDAARLELARTLNATRQPQAAGELLADLLANRQTLRAVRWQAVLLADELDAARGALWQGLLAKQTSDSEIQMVLQALAQKQSLAITPGSAAYNTWQRLHARQPREAVLAFVAARVADANAALAWRATDTRWSLVRLYAAQQQAGAALRLSERDERLRAATDAPDLAALRETVVSAASQADAPGLLALSSRVERARQTERKATLAALAQAAEQLNDFERAARFEAARLALVNDAAERTTLLQRIETLQARQDKGMKTKELRYRVDDQALSLRYQ